MGHAAYRRKALDVLFPTINDIKFARIGVRTRELWLPEVGVSELFLCTSSDADSGQTGNAIGEPRVPRRSRSHYLSNAPGLADQLVASRKDSAREGGCPVPDLRKSELGLVRYGPANRGHRGVFGPFEGSFPIGIPAGPDKILAIREFHVVHGCVFFPMCPGSQINLLRVRKTLCASVTTSVGKMGRISKSWRNKELRWDLTQAVHRGRVVSEGSTTTNDDPSKEAECSGASRNFQQNLESALRGRSLGKLPMSDSGRSWYQKRGGQFDPVFGLVNGPVKPWSNLVNLGQTWSNLVKALQTLGDVSRTTFQGFLGTVGPSRVGNGSVKPRSNFGSTLVKLGRLGSGCLVLRADTRENPGVCLGLRASPSGVQMGIPGLGEDRSGCEKTIRGLKWTLIDDQSSPTRPIAANRVVSTVWNLSPNRLRGDLTWELPKLQIGWFQRFGISVQTAANRVVSTVWNLSPNRLRGDLTWELPKLQIGWFQRFGISVQTAANRVVSTVWNLSPNRLRGDLTWGTTQAANRVVSTVWNLSPNSCKSGGFNGLESQSKQMSDRGSGSGGHRRSDRLAKGKAVAYAPESSPDTDDEYGCYGGRTYLALMPLSPGTCRRSLMPRLLVLAPSTVRPPSSDLVVVIGRSARPSETTRPSPQPGVTTGPSDAPSAAPRRPHTRSTGIPPSRLKRQRTEGIPDSAGTIPEDYVAPGFRYPPHGGIRPRYPVAVEISDTPLLTNLLAHPSSLVRRCQEPPDSAGRGGWSDFCRLLEASRPEYREFLIELGFGPFLSIPYVSVYHPAVWCFIERFFHHTGTFHLSTCEMAVLPVDWSAILGIRFGGRAPPSEPIDGFEAREILGLADRDAIEGVRRPSVRIRHLADVLRRDREEPPTELRYRQWAAYFIFSCFLGNDRSIVPTPIVGMFRDIDTLREYDWGALTYGFYIRGLRRYSRRESISFLGFWQFTVFWAFEHFPTFAPSRLPLASDPDFPLARRWDSSRIERMTARTLLELRMTVDCIRDADIIFQPYSAALSQRPEVFRAVALSRLRLWIRTSRSWELLLGERTVRQLGDEAVVPVDPSPLMTIEDVHSASSELRVAASWVEWPWTVISFGLLGRSRDFESEVLRLQLELSVSVDRHTADMDRVQGRDGQYADGGDTARGGDGAMQRDLASRDAEVARLAAAVRRLEEQLQGMGITPVTGADLSGLGQPSSSPPRDPVSRDWFFDDPPSS
uniref:Aminotransferase-like plant mobile domain-containing protein n=1 Tax=Fagus sylvatica TaxID=28930 RepID=A0A2N9HUX7_FAGSY